MLKNKKIEEKVAETILQESQIIQIGKKTYDLRPASVATLIQVSKLISKLPDVKLEMENNADVLVGTLMIANKCEVIGLIAATLILGVNKPVTAPPTLERFLRWLTIGFKDRHEILGEKILYELGPKGLNSLVMEQLSRLEISFFFGTITSLLEVNILRKTKGVV